MSLDMTSERVCYVHCNFCTTILAVSVPCSSMFTMVTVRCGHCANLLSVNMGALIQSSAAHGHLQDFQKQQYGGGGGGHEAGGDAKENNGSSSSSSSSRYCNGRYVPLQAEHEQQPKMPAIRPPEKRQRVPSAYNRFIKEEIQRIKAGNPEISHREAFSTAAKNWAHFPHIHFGLSNKQAKLTQEHVAGGEGSVAAHKSLGFY